MSTSMGFRLKEGMLLGAASAATQIEGGDLGHSWNDWYKKGRMLDGSDPARATDHYRLWREDADLMAEMGLKAYRLGIEWARLCPEEGRVDEAAVAHYRKELTYLRDKGISVLLTVHHFTNPMWFEKKGGFAKAANLKYYLDLVTLVTRSFGDLVSEYITINEPNVYAVYSYFYGTWPPGEKSFVKAVSVMSNLAACHIAAYELIHNIRREMGFSDTKVSCAMHLRIFEPERPYNLWNRTCSSLMEYFFQGAISQAICCGRFVWPLKSPNRNVLNIKKGEYIDFISINYYSRTTVSGFHDGVRSGAPKNDLGWEIYPEGIILCLEKFYRILKRPIYISENGTCDNNDTFRSKYIYEHLKLLCESRLPVQRYYHWCFCDNFEWLEGESARFGLVHVDYGTQKRTIKNTGLFYSDIIRAGGVTDESYNKYVEGEKYEQ